MTTFKVKAERVTQYGFRESITSTKKRVNAWVLSEEMREKGWTKVQIREVKN